MTLKIKPHAVDQDSGTFIFPSVLVTDSIITGSVTVFDESVLKGQADAFNFAGDNVEAVMSGTTAHIMVTGTAGGGGGHETGTMVIYDESDWVGVFEEMRFIGDGVDAYNSGSYVAVSIPSGGASGGTPVSVTTGTFYVEEVLYDMTLGSATGSFIIPGISQEYDHLKIIANLRTDDTAVAEMVYIYFNNDKTASNYRFAQHYAGAAHNDGEGDGSYFTAVPAATALGDEWNSVLAFINDYTDTGKRKSVNAEGGDRQSTTVEYERQHLVWWENTNAINQIEIATDGADFITGSRLQVIGVKETVLITSVEGGGGHLTGTVVVYEEDTFLGVFEEMRFIGDGVTALNSGSYAAIAITGTAGGGGHETGTMVIYDEGDWLGVFEEMRFLGDGVNAYNSGSYVAVSIPSGGASGGTSVTVTTGTFYIEEVLYDVTLGSTTGSIVVPDISQEYDHLKILLNARTDRAAGGDALYIYFNGDTTDANYRSAEHYGGSAHDVVVGDNPRLVVVPAATSVANDFGVTKGLIFDYTGSLNKNLIGESGDRDTETDIYSRQHSVYWESVAAINRIDVVSSTASDFIIGTRFQIIGIKETVLVTSVEGGGLSGGNPVSVTTGTFYIETLLDEVYLESTTGSIIMPGISQEYDHLKIMGSLRGSESAESTNVNILFNGDTTEANYKTARHIGGTVHVTDVGDWPIMGACPAATATAGEFASFESFIPDYTNPTKKAGADTLTGQRSSANTTYDHQHRTTWESDAAVNRIDIDPRLTDGFVSGTWVQLFGLREETVVTSVEGGGGHLTGTVVVYEEDTFLGVFEEMRFIGDGVTALNSGSYAAVSIPSCAEGAGVYNDSVISIPNTTSTALTFNSERWDTDNIHSTVSNTGRLTCKTAGIYQIEASASMLLNTGKRFNLYIKLNDANFIAVSSDNEVISSGRTKTIHVSRTWKMEVDDYIEAYIYHDMGVATDVSYLADYSPEFTMQRIG